MQPTGIPLQYAPGTPTRLRRIWRRALRVALASTTGVLVALSAFWFVPEVVHHYRQVERWRKQGQAVTSPAQVVYDDDPARAVALLASAPASGYIPFPQGGTSRPGAVSWVNPAERSGSIAIFYGSAFLHTRLPRCRDAREQLVEMDLISRQEGDRGVTLGFRVMLSHPRQGWGGVTVSEHRSTMLLPGLNEKTNLRLFAGQADPGDRSHFTIRYEADQATGLVDGWLNTNAGVDLQVRAAHPTD